MAARSNLILAGDAPERPSVENDARRRYRTVVVDDSDTFLKVTCDLLDLEDVIDLVAAASDGVEAITTVARLKPALVLMDISMPGLDVLSAAALMAEMSPAPIVVMISSKASPRRRAVSRRAGACDFLHNCHLRNTF